MSSSSTYHSSLTLACKHTIALKQLVHMYELNERLRRVTSTELLRKQSNIDSQRALLGIITTIH